MSIQVTLAALVVLSALAAAPQLTASVAAGQTGIEFRPSAGEDPDVELNMGRNQLMVLVLVILLFLVGIPGALVWWWMRTGDEDRERSLRS